MTWVEGGGSGAAAILGLYGVTLVLAAYGSLTPKRSSTVGILCFALVMASVAVVGVLLEAHFIAVTQLVCYSTAAIVLFLVALMLLDRGGGQAEFVRPSGPRIVLGCGAAIVTFGFLRVLLPSLSIPITASVDLPAGHGGVRAFGALLVGDHPVIVAAVGVLLLAAIVSAASFAGRREG